MAARTWIAGIGVVICVSCAIVVAQHTPLKRWLIVWQINDIAAKAKSHPETARYVQSLVEIAQGPTTSSTQRFRAIYAIASLGSLRSEALPVVSELVVLLDSPCDGVSQQAARALEELGAISGVAADRIARRVEKPSHDTTTWLAVNALGACGAAAQEHIPLLRSLEGREPEMFSGAVARAIQAIEQATEREKEQPEK